MDSPSVSRRKIVAIRREEEAREDVAQRVHFLLLDAHPEVCESTMNEIAVEVFLRGSKDNHAAEVAMENDPLNIERPSSI
jgi:hypothetical protein